MFQVYADNVLIYDDESDSKETKVINPKLIIEDSKAGSFSMTVPPINNGYSSIVRMKTDIIVKKDGEIYWQGRVLQENKDFWNQRVLTCEGELAFLNDTIQPPCEYNLQGQYAVKNFFLAVLDEHNSKVPANRRFVTDPSKVVVTVYAPDNALYRTTNYDTTISCLGDKLLGKLGGHFVLEHQNGERILNYLAESYNLNTQTVNFGKNLIDFTRSFDSAEYATVIVPLGKRLETEQGDPEGLEKYLTVASVNAGSIYIQSSEAVSNYGWIVKVVHFDDVEDAMTLLSMGQQYLSDMQFDTMVIELSALDLHYLNPEIESVKLGDSIRVISEPHGLDRVFPVRKMDIPLDRPENTVFTLGTEVQTSLTSSNTKTNAKVQEQIETLKAEQVDVLDEAQANATAIMNMAVTGYVTITRDEYGSNVLYFSETRDYTQAQKLWKWSMAGLAYSNDGGATWGTAITMDGSIVADYITAGTLNGSIIQAGTVNANKIYVEDSQGGTTTALDVALDGLNSTVEYVGTTAVKQMIVEYALGTSETAAPTSGWSTTAPAWEDGKYMWQRTTTVFIDDTPTVPHRSTSSPTCLTGATGQPGTNGYNTAVLYLYKRAASQPSTSGFSTMTYNFGTDTLSSKPSDWYREVPPGTDPLWVTVTTAYGDTNPVSIAGTAWSTPVKMAQNGADGSPGTNGLNSATVFLYQRATSTPAKPTGNITYNFSDGSITGSYGNWSTAFPATDNGKPCYVIQTTASSMNSSDTIAASEWSSPKIIVEDGVQGPAGYNTAIVYLYTRSSTTPSTSGFGTLTYDFDQKRITSTAPTGWYKEIPSGSDPLYVTAATAYSNTSTDTIAANEWSTPEILAQNGTDGSPGTPGSPGTNGLNVATVFLYKRASSTPSAPNVDITYTFADGSVTPSVSTTGWDVKVPTSDGYPCYLIQATASSSSSTDTIIPSEWSSPIVLVEDGTDGLGIASIITQYNLSTSNQTPTGTWTETAPQWQSGRYIWIRSKITWDNNTVTYTTPQLDNALNGLSQNYTTISQTVNSLTLEAVASTSTDTVLVDVGTIDGSVWLPTDDSQAFMFEMDSDGYYTSQNAGVNNSYSLSKFTFNFSSSTTVVFKCIDNAERGYDYGIISKVDTNLTPTRTEDASGNVTYSFKNVTPSSSVVDVSITIPSGEHFVMVKFVKDSSTHISPDYFKVRPTITKTETNLTKTTLILKANQAALTSAEIAYTGLVKFSDLAGNGTTIINGANILTGTISADKIKTEDLIVSSVYHNGQTQYKTFGSALDGPDNLDLTITIGTPATAAGWNEERINMFASILQITMPDENWKSPTHALIYDVYNSIIGPANNPISLGGRLRVYNSYVHSYFDKLYLGPDAFIYVDRSDENLYFENSSHLYQLTPP